MKNATRNDVAKQIKVLDIARKHGIALESASAGNFDYRCKCPSSDHKSGREKTSSLYINSRDNNFFCYGCNKGVSSIDFYMMCTNKTFPEALQDLKPLVKNPGTYQDTIDQKKVTFPVLLKTSEILREFLINNPEQLENMTTLLRKIDKISFEVSKDDSDKIEEMNVKLKKMLESK